MPADVYDAIILAGGAGSRLGGVDKAAVPLAGDQLIGAALRAAAGAHTLVVVGETGAELPARARRTVEDPPGSGPAAAALAGLEAITDPQPWTVLLACDLPGAEQALPRALAAADDDGAVLLDPEGYPQWVLGVYRTSALRRAKSDFGDPRNRSLRSLLGGLDLRQVSADGPDWSDVDTWADHDRWSARLREPTEPEHDPARAPEPDPEPDSDLPSDPDPAAGER